MARHSRRPLTPRYSLPPLTFSAPSLQPMPANDNHGSDPRATAPAPGDDLAAILAVIPSVPPPPVVDPSFTSPVAPMILRRAPRVEPPEPWYLTALARGLGWVGALGDALTASRLGRWRVPLAVTLALALAGLFCEVGVGVRGVRRLLRLWAALVG